MTDARTPPNSPRGEQQIASVMSELDSMLADAQHKVNDALLSCDKPRQRNTLTTLDRMLSVPTKYVRDITRATH